MVSAFALTYWGTEFVRRLTVRWNILDVPSARSSHDTPTPRGGGVVFSILLLLAAAGLTAAGAPHRDLWIALLGGGVLVAAVGWLDDYRKLPSFMRLTLYALAAGWAVGWIGGLPAVDLGCATLRLGAAGYVVSWAIILAFTNVYNFMEGIDGLAAGEGATVSFAAGALLISSGEPVLGWVLIGLGAALLGFLRWNWEPARIFMGDVGSNLLGFVFATLALTTGRFSNVSPWVWALLLGVFVVDGFATFGRRLIRRLPPQQAHRSHAYQGAVQKGHSHAQVTGVVIGINALLAALAVAAWLFESLAVGLVGIAYTVLLGIHFRYSPLGRRGGSRRDTA